MNTRSFVHLFEAQAARTPDAIALVTGSLSWTYAELDARANRLAHALRARGIGAGHVVAIALPRSGKMVLNALAVMKAGAAFMPVDPSYPAQRLAHMFQDARPACVLTDSATLPTLPTRVRDAGLAWVLDADASQQQLRDQPDGPVAHTVQLGDLAYVIYTSGSTGQPKGVLITHQGIANLADALVAHLQVDAQARVLQMASPSFDAAVMEMLMAFGAGATLVVPLRELVVGEILADVLRELHISHALIPPATLASIPEDGQGFPDLKVLAVGGEACPPELVARWAPGRRMVNAYGPTEITVCATMSTPMQPGARIAIGQPLPQVQTLVLDDRLRPVPTGVAGELYIGGIGLARGYLDRAPLTAQRFVANPYGPPGSRMYRTGDLVRWRVDRTLEFVGRSDRQVKLRGLRIELGEIESLLAAQPGVRGALVLLREDQPGQPRLVAYLLPDAGTVLDVQALRDALARQLPDHMLPSAMVSLPAWPLTANGKLDHAALPAPDGHSLLQPARPARPPRTPTESRVCELCARVLGQAAVDDADANFFDIGGHSLLAIRLGRLIRDELRPDFPVAGVYATPVLSVLAARIDGEAPLSEDVDLGQEARLPSDIPTLMAQRLDALQPAAPTQLSHVFLTGASGYVGAHLLATLLRDTAATVWCHVRAADARTGRERLLAALHDQHLQDAWDASRVEVLLGDLAQPDLGMTVDAVQQVRERCDAIVHCGAQVDFLHGYAGLKAANVEAVKTLLRWTVQGRAKRMHHISTLGIVDAAQGLQGTVNECTPLKSWKGLIGGYSQSKWVADTIACQAQAAGVPVAIYRLGSVTGDHVHGLCNARDFIWRMAQVCAGLGAIPDLDLSLNMTPVCDVARAIVRLSTCDQSAGQVYHLLSGHELSLQDLGAVFERLGVPTRHVSVQAWAQLARSRMQAGTDDELLAVLAILARHDGVVHRPPHIVGEATQRKLEALGVPIRRVSRELLGRYLQQLGVVKGVQGVTVPLTSIH
ncbi:MAG: amino acid adenylation domain-containing protein [Aquabacterium sp.]